MGDTSTSIFAFRPFHLDAAQRSLTRDGQPIALTPKEFDTLLVLVEAGGKVMSKEGLLRQVWPDSYVGDGSLARNISVLRKALGDGVIETLPRRGYRVAVPVSIVSAIPERTTAEIAQGPHLDSATDQATDAREVAQKVSVAQEIVAGPSGVLDRSSKLAPKWWVRPAQSRWLAYAAILAFLSGAIAVLNRKSISHASVPSSFSGSVRIAVLPFANYTGDPQRDYLCDGMTEATISELSRLSPGHMSVIARTSAMKFKSTDKAIPEIARELKADYILESSVRSSGEQMRVTTQLVRGSDASHVWTGEYERTQQNMLDIQQEVAVAVAQEIRLSLDASVRKHLRGALTVDPEAYQDYLLGRYNWNKRNREGLLESVRLFDRAIARDPGYAEAYAGLADSYLVLGGGYLPDIETYNKARAAALKALELDDTLSDAYTSLAYEKFVNERDMAGADEDYQRALTLDANNANAHHWYGIYLSAMRRHDEAIQHINRALELDPLAIGIRYNAGWIYMVAGRTDEALAIALRALEMDPSSAPAHGTLGAVYLAKGEYDRAIAEVRAAQSLRADHSPYLVEVAQIYAIEGKKEQARKLLASALADHGWSKVAPYSFALTYASLGEKDKAFYWLKRSVNDHSCTAMEINNDHGLDPLRSDPRFSEIARPFSLGVEGKPAI